MLIVCINIGNTHIFGGVFLDGVLERKFRYPSSADCTSDTFGLFLHAFFEQHKIKVTNIDAVVISSVVPGLECAVFTACKDYLALTPLVLKPGVKTGLKLAIKNALELGADRVANAVASVRHFPNKNILIVNYGTATTVCAVSKDKAYLGGAILPGLKLNLESLSEKTAKLFHVEIIEPDSVLGKSTLTQLQSGLVYGQLGATKEIVSRIAETHFCEHPPVILSTGEYAGLFEKEGFFHSNVPDLVLHGLRLIWEYNRV